MAATVVNKRKEPYDVYIGRGGPWGNPFVIGKDGDRAEVIRLYREHLRAQINGGLVSKEALASLDNKRLGCFCKPQACHGDVIAEAVEWATGSGGSFME